MWTSSKEKYFPNPFYSQILAIFKRTNPLLQNRTGWRDRKLFLKKHFFLSAASDYPSNVTSQLLGQLLKGIFLFLWTGMLPYAPYRSLSISKLFCKDGGGGCGGIRYEFRRYSKVREGGRGALWIIKDLLGTGTGVLWIHNAPVPFPPTPPLSTPPHLLLSPSDSPPSYYKPSLNGPWYLLSLSCLFSIKLPMYLLFICGWTYGFGWGEIVVVVRFFISIFVPYFTI